MKCANYLLVNYSVKEGSVNKNIGCIDDILEELRARPVADVFYAVYQIGVSSFIHLQSFPNEEVTKEIFQRSAFQRFFSELESTIDQEPLSNDVEKIGFYRSF
jgi:hypothetical protein